MTGSVGATHSKRKCFFTIKHDVVRYNKTIMLQLSSMLTNRPVLSLRVGSPIATTLGPIINPNNLKVEGFYCQEERSRRQRVLLDQDIRDIIPQGIIVNDQDALSDADELVRLHDIINLGFDVIGKMVMTTSKEKIGKVNDYAVEVDGLYIQKLYITRSLFKSLNSSSLGIDRTQIVEITDHAIIINDLHGKVPAAAQAVA
jgi:sporulation protein YlmC with PRC-barrel domain